MNAGRKMAIIETKNLTYTYPGATKPSIVDVSIKVEKGEFVLITGPSGCGKTTLCRCFNGLVPHFYQGELKGEITVAGEDTLKRHTYEMAKHVGLVFQNPENQLFALSVEKDVAFGLENMGVPREEMRKRLIGHSTKQVSTTFANGHLMKSQAVSNSGLQLLRF